MIAIRRECRETAPDDWLDKLESIQGVIILSTSENRAQFGTSREALKKVHKSFDHFCHLEKINYHNY